jgi:hypothetical protein
VRHVLDLSKAPSAAGSCPAVLFCGRLCAHRNGAHAFCRSCAHGHLAPAAAIAATGQMPDVGQHTWYVGVSDQRIATLAAQRSRNWLPHAFGLSARLRAFSSGYRVVPIPDRNGHAPKSSKSAAPAKAVARRVGALPPKGHPHDFAARYTGSPLPCRATTSCGRLRRMPHHFTPSGKSSQRDHRPP